MLPQFPILIFQIHPEESKTILGLKPTCALNVEQAGEKIGIQGLSCSY